MCDPADVATTGAGNPWRGWADRLAESLAVRAAAQGASFEYANLAIRGRLLTQIVDEQVPAALALKPDLVSVIGGGNDVLRPGADVDAVVARLEDAVARLRAEGVAVLMATSYDPRLSPLVKRTRGMAGIFAAHVWSIARRHDAYVLDLWGMRSLQDRRMWAEDRIHLTSQGHARVAAQAVDVLGLTVDPLQDNDSVYADWETPLDPLPARRRQEAWQDDAQWVREHVVPWLGRRLRGRSSGDGLPPKRPVPAHVDIPTPR
jgi:lysophospholipase L1-like esterase